MSSPIALANILSDMQDHAGLGIFEIGSAVEPDDAMRYLRSSAERLTVKLHQTIGANYFTRFGAIFTQAGVSQASLPADHFKLIAMGWVRSSTEDPVPLRLATANDYTLVNRNPKHWDATNQPFYDLQGNTVAFFPCPADIYELQISYTTRLVIPDNVPGANFSGEQSWATYLALDATLSILRKAKRFDDMAEVKEERALIWQDIADAQAQRDEYGTAQVSDDRGALTAQTFMDRGPRWGSGRR